MNKRKRIMREIVLSIRRIHYSMSWSLKMMMKDKIRRKMEKSSIDWKVKGEKKEDHLVLPLNLNKINNRMLFLLSSLPSLSKSKI